MHAVPHTTAEARLRGRLIKVNQVGENGAVNIYRAQALVCRLTAPDLVPLLREFQGHEEGQKETIPASSVPNQYDVKP